LTGTFEQVAIERLRESPTNPRKHFEPTALEELTRSIAAHGMLNPILTRPWPSGKDGALEVVCGARRLRAARAAKLKLVPVRIEPLGDDQVLETQVIENLQREDVHPLDEATGYRALLETGRYSASDIAQKVGKSEPYVYQRLKLTDLVENGQKAFWAEKLGLSQALLISRLEPGDQEAVLKDLKRRDYDWRAPELAGWIERSFLLKFKGAAFKAGDATLLPEAGACTTCPKRTGANTQLFPEVKGSDRCTDPACYRAKLQAHIAGKQTEYQAKGEELLPLVRGYVPYGEKQPKGALDAHSYAIITKKTRCDHARSGIVVAGDDPGRVLEVCVDPKCKQHRPGAGGYRDLRDPKEVEAERQRQLERKQKMAAYAAATEAVISEANSAPLFPTQLKKIVDVISAGAVYRIEADDAKAICRALKLEAMKGSYGAADHRATLAQHAEKLEVNDRVLLLLRIALHALDQSDWTYGGEKACAEFDRAAALFGVDPQQHLKEIRAKAKAAERKKKVKTTKRAKPRKEPKG
jgi:ParB family chromosome partitioning protein